MVDGNEAPLPPATETSDPQVDRGSLQYGVCAWIQQLLASPMDPERAESLEVALACLQAGLNIQEPGSAPLTPTIPLPSVWSHGVAAMHGQTGVSSPTHPVPSNASVGPAPMSGHPALSTEQMAAIQMQQAHALQQHQILHDQMVQQANHHPLLPSGAAPTPASAPTSARTPAEATTAPTAAPASTVATESRSEPVSQPNTENNSVRVAPRASAGAGASSGAGGGVDASVIFSKFVDSLSNKGYFEGMPPGTAPYTERWENAKRKFIDKYPQYSAAIANVSAPPMLSPAELQQHAERFKSEGNTALQAQKYTEAVELYNKAIAVWEENAVYFSNRAAAFLQLKEYDKAICDCEASIKIDPNYAKAYNRLGSALFSKGRFQDAIDMGYKKANALEPQSEAHKAGLKLCQDKVEKSAKATTTQDSAGGEHPQNSQGEMGASIANALDDNPAMRQQLDGMLGGMGMGGGLNDVLNNPALMSMAENMMQDPNAMQAMMSQLSGMPGMANLMGDLGGAMGGAMGGTPPTNSDQQPGNDSSDPDTAP